MERNNPSYPHNFLILNTSRNTIKIGNTGTRHNDLPNISSSAVLLDETPPDEQAIRLENPAIEWPQKKKTTRRKKAVVADDSDSTI